MVASTTTTWIARLPKAAAFVRRSRHDDNIIDDRHRRRVHGELLHVAGHEHERHSLHGGAPFPTSIMAKGSITGQTRSDLAQGTGKSNPQSLGVIYGTGGSVPLPGVAGPLCRAGLVPDLTSYLSLSDQLNLETGSAGRSSIRSGRRC